MADGSDNGALGQDGPAPLAGMAWHHALDAIREPVFIHDRDLRVVWGNDAYLERAGMALEAASGRQYWEVFPRRDGPLEHCLRSMETGRETHEVLDLDGGRVLLSRSFPLSGATEGWSVHILEDVTELRQAERRAEQANRGLRTLSASNQALVRAGEEQALLGAICDAAIAEGGYGVAWVCFAPDTPGERVRSVAARGEDPGIADGMCKPVADDPAGSPAATAIYRHAPVSLAIAEEAAAAPGWMSNAYADGYRAVIALPLLDGDAAYGALTLLARDPDAFGEEEVTVLEELAGDLAYGVLALRDREAYFREREVQRRSLVGMVRAVAHAIEMRDPYTTGHQERVAELAAAIAREMGLEESRVEGVRLGALVHDIGKIGVPAEILSRPGRLSDMEFEMIKGHPEAGWRVLAEIEFPWPMADMVYQHHERLDGSGYPEGVAGSGIILEARILAVADVVEAMASHRPYRPAVGIDAALDEIADGRGGRYDPDVADACLGLFREGRFSFASEGSAPAR